MLAAALGMCLRLGNRPQQWGATAFAGRYRPPMNFLVVGEALVDLVRGRDGSVVTRAGGSPANVAVGLGRLGYDVQLLTALGDDPHGRLLTDHLEDSGVQVFAAPLASTGLAQAILDGAGKADYVLDITWDLAGLTPPTAPDWLHLGSIGATLQPGADHAAALLDRYAGQARTSYDPNCRPLLMGDADLVRPRIESLVGKCDVVKLSDEDAAWLLPGLDPEAVLRRWATSGPSLVAMTLGERGVVALVDGQVLEVPVPHGPPIVDTVGAGDAFMTGLIAALSGGASGHEALTRASLLARRTCERVGADPPWAETLVNFPGGGRAGTGRR